MVSGDLGEGFQDAAELAFFFQDGVVVLLEKGDKFFGVAPLGFEDGRWDFRTTIVFKNAQIANDNFDSAPLLKQLFPDQDSYKKEEQRRFEILDAHWDVPIKDFDLDAR